LSGTVNGTGQGTVSVIYEERRPGGDWSGIDTKQVSFNGSSTNIPSFTLSYEDDLPAGEYQYRLRVVSPNIVTSTTQIVTLSSKENGSNDIWTKKWGEISTNEQNYTLNVEINENIDIKNIFLREDLYKDKINSITLQNAIDGQVTQVTDLQEIVNAISNFSNDLLFKSGDWNLGLNNLITTSDILFSNTFHDNSNNQYPINALFGMDGSDIQKIRNNLLGFREGTDYYNNRYNQYKKNYTINGILS
jgi:hypothetical protein